MGFCECKKTRTKEVMRVLRNTHGAKELQRKTGRPIDIQEAEVLLFDMCKHQEGFDEARIQFSSKETPEGSMRVMRIQQVAASSSHRPKHKKQRVGEYSDAMQALPRFLAHDGKEAWSSGCWENAVPRIAVKVPFRTDRLKRIGNGQVPSVVALAWNTLTNQNDAT